MCMHYSTCVKARRPCGVGCLFLPLCGFWGLNLGHQTYMASVSPAEPLFICLFVFETVFETDES